MAARYRVLVTDDRFGDYTEERSVLEPAGGELVILEHPDKAGLLKAVADADAMLANQAKVDADVIAAAPKCKIISRYGIGYDNVALDAATAAGIWVARVPDYCFEEVAEHSLALLLACARKVPMSDRGIRKGQWDIHSRLQIRRMEGRVLGILGFGGTGRALYRKAKTFGFGRILVCDHHLTPEEAEELGVVLVDFERLLRQSDYLSLHIPMRAENRHILDERAFHLMKADAVLVNTARGPVVDTQALLHALDEGTIGCAGLDVFENEPPVTEELLDRDNLILTDHSAYYSVESLADLKRKAAQNILEVWEGRKPLYPVNDL